MPIGAYRPCRVNRCANLHHNKNGFCDAHQNQAYCFKKTASEAYKERNRFYQRASWKRARQTHLDANPLCIRCRAVAVHVDHIKPLAAVLAAGGTGLEPENMQSLCHSCHSSKTMKESRNKSHAA